MPDEKTTLSPSQAALEAQKLPSTKEAMIRKVDDLIFTVAQEAEQKNVARSISFAQDLRKLVLGLFEILQDKDFSPAANHCPACRCEKVEGDNQ